MSGWWEQLDEVEALQSIYGEERFSFRVDGLVGVGEEEDCLVERLRGLEPGPRAWSMTCQIDIEVEVPCGEIGISRGDESVSGAAVVATVKHVPPVRISVFMQPGYPEHDRPTFQVSSCWLDNAMTSRIEEELDAWEVDGSPVVFACCEHVRCMLVESGSLYSRQSIQVSSDDAVRLLLQYSSVRDGDLFTDGMHTCSICYEELPGSRFTVLHCGHYFCTLCLQSQLHCHITEGDVDAIRCANIECRDMLEPHEVKALVDADMFERWQDVTLTKFLSAMPDAAYCPRCSSVSIEDTEDNSADCPKCFFVFCTLCEEGRHPGIECVGPETKLEILRKKAAGGGRTAVAELRRKEQEYQSLIEIKKTSKSCPACGMAIHKVQGCNKMICASCGCFFCYKCGADISDVGYDHYKDGKNCVLFDYEEILRWERQWDMLGGHEQPREPAGLPPPPQHHTRTFCPNCGQCNFRIAENNHIHCWSCAQYYCSRCRQILPRRRSGAHFGKGGCPQHG